MAKTIQLQGDSAISVEMIETPSLGDRSYIAHDGKVAVVIDPQRDIDRVFDIVERLGVNVTHVVETHVHNDYVTGGLELSKACGAAYVLPEDSDVSFECVTVKDGDTISTGQIHLRVMKTPGHTFHHASYVLSDATDNAVAVFTGGSLLFGATGRTDLVGEDSTVELTHAQFHSAQRLAAELPDATAILPTHGFGSFCSATPTSGTSSTIGEQRKANPVLTLDEQRYVDELIAGLDAFPAYYARMGPINQQGPAPIDLSMPTNVEPAELRVRIESGEWVVDLRKRTAFSAGHLAGSLGFELSDHFATYLGWLYRIGTPLTLIGESPEQITKAQRELARIGIDDIAGSASGDIASLGDGDELRAYEVSDFAGLAVVLKERSPFVLDARRKSERDAGFVKDSHHIALHDLMDRVDEVPDGEVWVYCGSGYRASIAASLLDRPGRDVVLINDDYASAKAAGLESE